MSHLFPVTTILMLSANPKGISSQRLEQEKRDIEEGLRLSRNRDQFRLEIKSAARSRDLQRAMLDLNPQIVHFSGQGEAEAGLLFEDEVGQPKPIDAAALAGLFKLFADQLQCVVLNACYSEPQAEAIAQHIPYVIGMDQAIDERAALEFAVGFYDALGAGRDIEFAYRLGCSAACLDGLSEDLIPIFRQKSGLDSTSFPEHTAPQKQPELSKLSSRTPLKPKIAKEPLTSSSLQSRHGRLSKFKTWLNPSTLIGLTIASLVNIAVISLYPQIRQSLGMGKPICFEKATKEKKLIVALAQVQPGTPEINGKLPFLKSQLFGYLKDQEKGNVEICSVSTEVSDETAAKALGEKLNASIVVWGRQDSSSVELKVTTVKLLVSNLTTLLIPLTDAQDPEKVRDIAVSTNIMVAFALSKIYEQVETQHLEARQSLEDALRLAELANVNLNNKFTARIFSQGYYFLGQLYVSHDKKCPDYRQDCLKALSAFKKTTAINPAFYQSFAEQAFIEQGILLEQIDNTDEAINIYSQLIKINPESEKGIIARGNRAALYLAQENFQQAMKDLQVVCQEPRNPYYWYWLSLRGRVELLTGQIDKAKNTFQEVRNSIDIEKDLPEILGDLNRLAQQKQDLKPAIQSIIQLIQVSP